MFQEFRVLLLAITLAGLTAASATPAHAVAVTAGEFFGACPGPIFVSQDTEISGAVQIPGDCTVSVDAGFALTMDRVKLTAGTFRLQGDASSVSITKSKLSSSGADGITLDSEGPMTIAESKIVAVAGGINIPPKGDLLVDGSAISAFGQLVIGGPGGLRQIVGSQLSSETEIRLAPGFTPTFQPTSTTIDSSTLVSLGSIKFWGASSYDILDSRVEALGGGSAIDFGQGAYQRTCNLVDSSFSSPGGNTRVWGACDFFVQGTKLDAMGSIDFGLGGTTTLDDASLAAETGPVTWMGGAVTIDGSDLEGTDLTFGNGGGVAVAASSLQTPGSIRVQTAGPVTFDDSKLTAEADSPTALWITNGSGRSITNSKVKIKNGGAWLIGGGPLVLGNIKLSSKSDEGLVLEGSSSANISNSRISTLGQIAARYYDDISISLTKVKTEGGLGLLAESGSSGDSTLTESSIKGPQMAIRSYGSTSAIDNKLIIEGTVELSSVGTCTSSGNNPDVACF
ncbi:MAG TPA: right-handed parallel beta-helix repeat-containing protein [Candidatus Limnocylindrales bacterium]|nr:right-handed parallel beta-helix repeat-containing protein [Candidatus Limnocylindrales bacterium]